MSKEELDSIRSQALKHAGAYLADIGFTQDSTGWRGRLDLGVQGAFTAKLVLPDRFPHELPWVFVDRASLPCRVPHIEKTGKICLAPTTGVLLDTENPEGLIRDALTKGRKVLQQGLARANQADFQAEFLAYWNGSETCSSLCDVLGQAREI